MSLNPKQQRFCEEYVVDLNATQAAIRAGYSEKTASQQGERLLRNVEIKSCIQKLQGVKSQETGITAEKLFLEIGRLAFSDVRKLFDSDGQLRPVHQLDDDTAAAISSVEVVVKPKKGDDGSQEVEHIHKIRLWDKNSALDKIAKHLGAYAPQKVEASIQMFESIEELHEAKNKGKSKANEYRNSKSHNSK